MSPVAHARVFIATHAQPKWRLTNQQQSVYKKTAFKTAQEEQASKWACSADPMPPLALSDRWLTGWLTQCVSVRASEGGWLTALFTYCQSYRLQQWWESMQHGKWVSEPARQQLTYTFTCTTAVSFIVKSWLTCFNITAAILAHTERPPPIVITVSQWLLCVCER